ncbi:MAG TPA: hypothetical protein VGM27_33615, partial [Acidobacteriaceae bacterium]
MITYSIRCDECHRDYEDRSTVSASFLREDAAGNGWQTSIPAKYIGTAQDLANWPGGQARTMDL